MCTHDKGIVLRSTYHVFDMYVNELGQDVLDIYCVGAPSLTVKGKDGHEAQVDCIDIIATQKAGETVLAAVNKPPEDVQPLTLEWQGVDAPVRLERIVLSGESKESYNDADHNDAVPRHFSKEAFVPGDVLTLPPHSVSLLRFS